MRKAIDLTSGIKGKTAFVTGGLTGIGRAAVEKLLAHGANVAFTYARGQEAPGEAQALAASAPGRLSAHPLDQRYLESIRESVEGALERWGRLDILVNNAAVGSATVGRYADDPFIQDSEMFRINADGALKVCQIFMEKISAQKNESSVKIINLSSVGGGVQAFPKFRLSDGMSKAGVALMTRQLAAETVHRDIDVFAVCPGATRTKMFESSTLDPMSEDERTAFIASLPKKRLIEPSEIADIIIFLASACSTPMHGAVIDASMGLGVRPGIMTEMDLGH